MAEKRPAFQFYPKDYLSDENVALMSLEQEGAYARLMSYCWLQGSIPADTPSLARLCRVSEQDMERIWLGVEKCFRRGVERYTHPRLDAERRKQDAHSKAKSDAGKAGAKAKHDKDNSGSATVLPVAESSFAVCSLQSASASAIPTTMGERHPGFVEWLGPRADCLDGIEVLAQKAIWGMWGPHGLQEADWKGVGPSRRPAVMATFLLAWRASRRREFHRRFARAIFLDTIDDAIASDRQAEQQGTEQAMANEHRMAAKAKEEAEIARLNREAELIQTGRDVDSTTLTFKPGAPRGTGLARVQA